MQYLNYKIINFIIIFYYLFIPIIFIDLKHIGEQIKKIVINNLICLL